MKIIVFLVALLGLISLSTQTNHLGFSCFRFINNSGFYNLEKISGTTNLTIPSIEGIDGQVQLNLCNHFVPANCQSNWNSFAYQIDDSTCTPLSYGET